MILAYAVALAGTVGTSEGLSVLVRGPLACFYREREDAPQASENEVREFFTSNQSLFAQADILEFRFPTVLHGIKELEEFVSRHEAAVLSELERLRGLAQLTAYLTKNSGVNDPARSGTEYLQKKSARAREQIEEIDAARVAAGTDLRDSVVHGNRLLLLVPRQVAPNVAQKILAHTGLVVAGPFPPSAFAKLLS